MKIDKRLIDKIAKTESKYLSTFVVLLNLLEEGDTFITPVGKIVKLKENNFTIVIDKSVISMGLDRILNDF